MRDSIALRPARPEDYDFAWRIYAEGIKPYVLAFWPWVDEEQSARFASQWKFDATRIICRCGADVGWLELQEMDEEFRLNQLYVASVHRYEGIGSEVLRLVLAQAGSKPVTLGVLKSNPARRLYERFGFVVVKESETKFFMTHKPLV